MQMQRLKIKHACMQWRHVQSYSASENRNHLKFARKKILKQLLKHILIKASIEKYNEAI